MCVGGGEERSDFNFTFFFHITYYFVMTFSTTAELSISTHSQVVPMYGIIDVEYYLLTCAIYLQYTVAISSYP